MMDLYSIGEMVIDMIPGSEPASYLRRAGGAPANVAIAVVKNGLKASLTCKVGNDDFGRFLIFMYSGAINTFECAGAYRSGDYHHCVCYASGGWGTNFYFRQKARGRYAAFSG